jgi:hypothetical protein
MWNICTDILLINSLWLSKWGWGLEMAAPWSKGEFIDRDQEQI